MSYMKNWFEQNALSNVFRDMQAGEAQNRRTNLERLAWEAQRAMRDYLKALEEYERDELNLQQQHAAAQAFEDEQTETF